MSRTLVIKDLLTGPIEVAGWLLDATVEVVVKDHEDDEDYEVESIEIGQVMVANELSDSMPVTLKPQLAKAFRAECMKHAIAYADDHTNWAEWTKDENDET